MSALAEQLVLPHISLFTRRWWILSIVAAIKCAHQLRENGPNEVLLSHLVPLLQFPDVSSQVSIAAIFHIQMQVMRRLQMLSMTVLHDIWVS
jgi:hypothetical protein